MSVKDKAAAIDRFVRTIKASGVYDDIQAACIMAGWTNLAGALYPLKGAAPTNVSGLFQNADLDPGIGLKGNGSNKYLSSNRSNNADGQDDNHNAFYLSAPPLIDGRHMMGSNGYGVAGANTIYGNLGYLGIANRSNGALVSASGQDAVAGFKGTSRLSAGSFSYRTGGATTAAAQASSTPTSQNIFVFCRNDASVGATLFSDATLSWYSIGSATDLAALDSAVSTLMADLRAIDEDGFDRDALAYIRNVEAADGSYLETGVKQAINAFVVGCKKDGIWDAIKASCILCGARTISGALVPLVGAAPTAYPQPVNFVSADYSRTTGLKGDGATKYLDSNRSSNADGLSDRHIACYVSSATTLNVAFAGSVDGVSSPNALSQLYWYSPNVLRGYLSSQGGAEFASATLPPSTASFVGASRSATDSVTARAGGVSASASSTETSGLDRSIFIFGRNYGTGTVNSPTDARLAFYSIGASLDLAALDTRVSTLVAAIAAAI